MLVILSEVLLVILSEVLLVILSEVLLVILSCAKNLLIMPPLLLVIPSRESVDYAAAFACHSVLRFVSVDYAAALIMPPRWFGYAAALVMPPRGRVVAPPSRCAAKSLRSLGSAWGSLGTD